MQMHIICSFFSSCLCINTNFCETEIKYDNKIISQKLNNNALSSVQWPNRTGESCYNLQSLAMPLTYICSILLVYHLVPLVL